MRSITSGTTQSAAHTAFVSDKAEIHGQVNFGIGCIAHPGCFIDARGGTINFGEYNIIEEKVRIVNKIRAKDSKGKPIMKDMNVGSYNIFEVGTMVSTSEIGDYNEFQSKCVVEDNCRVGSNCTLGPKVSLSVGMQTGNNKIIYEDDRYHVNDDMAQVSVKKQKLKEMANLLIKQLNVKKP